MLISILIFQILCYTRNIFEGNVKAISEALRRPNYFGYRYAKRVSIDKSGVTEVRV